MVRAPTTLAQMINDADLLEMFRAPSTSEKAFSLILQQFQKSIYYYVRRMVVDHDDADDITQTTFIKAWRGLDSFRGDAKLSTWLHTIAYRESITFINAKKKLGNVSIDDIEQSLPAALSQDELFTGDQIQAQLQIAIALLPEKQKAVFIMKYYEEKKYEEIAEITGTSVGALKASFHHAVQKIETYMKEKARF